MPHNIRLFTSFLAVAASFAATPATAGGVLTVAMTAGDIAVTTGTPDQGFEGFRFVGWSLYDGLVNWDLSKADAASDIKPASRPPGAAAYSKSVGRSRSRAWANMRWI